MLRTRYLRSVVLALLGVCLLAGIGPSRARAFRTAADLEEFDGEGAVRWRGSIDLVLNRRGEPSLSNDDVVMVLERALLTWADVECGSLVFGPIVVTDEHAEPGDGKNVVEWIGSGWQNLGLDPELPAVTEVIYEEVGGTFAIVEADVYLNAEHHAWSLSGEADSSERDLLSVLVHEVGHVLGLLHPCEVDDSDPSAPRCRDEDAREPVTMYPGYDPALATLSEDDRAGLCFLYPSDGSAAEPDADELTDADELADAGARPVAADGGSDAGPDGPTFGDACERGEDCASGLCLERSNGHSICTTECDPEHACSGWWRCQAFDGGGACVPPEDGSDCSVASPRPASSLQPLCVLSLSIISAIAHRSRRARRRRNRTDA